MYYQDRNQGQECAEGLERRGLIDDRARTQLTPQHSTPHQISCLPKIHKEGRPLRPIVSTIGSATYCLVKKLTRILTILVGNTSSDVKNSAEFSEIIRKMELDEKNLTVSFDVVSLFTRIDVDEALEILSSLLFSDGNLEERTTIPASALSRHKVQLWGPPSHQLWQIYSWRLLSSKQSPPPD